MKHGGDLGEAKSRHGEGPPDWLDLSTGINPLPWPVPAGLLAHGIGRLPAARDLAELLEAAREAYRVPDGSGIVAAPGTQALIQWLPRLAPPGGVAILGPTYSEHALAWAGAGREVRDAREIGQLVGSRNVVLVRPNNPDGGLPPAAEVLALADRVARDDGWVVVDESFADTVPEEGLAPRIGERPVILLRSFGKFFGLAGLRLGFAIGPDALVGRLRVALGPWAVAGPALAIGAAALRDRHWIAETRGRLERDAAALDRVLSGAGLVPLGGTSLFRLVRHADARQVHERLAQAHIWCRRFEDRPDLLRFGLPPDAAGLARLADALG